MFIRVITDNIYYNYLLAINTPSLVEVTNIFHHIHPYDFEKLFRRHVILCCIAECTVLRTYSRTQPPHKDLHFPTLTISP